MGTIMRVALQKFVCPSTARAYPCLGVPRLAWIIIAIHFTMPDPPLLDLVSSFLGPPPTSTSSSTQGNTEAAGNNGGSNHNDCASSSRSSIAPATPPKARVHQPSHATVIVFSKDRPWQLQQLLSSMKLSQVPSSSSAANLASTAPITSIDINIIARIDEPFDDGYHMVQENSNDY